MKGKRSFTYLQVHIRYYGRLCTINMLHTRYYRLHSTQYTLYNIHYTLYRLHSIQYTLYTVQCTLYNVQYIQCIHCTMYKAHTSALLRAGILLAVIWLLQTVISWRPASCSSKADARNIIPVS